MAEIEDGTFLRETPIAVFGRKHWPCDGCQTMGKVDDGKLCPKCLGTGANPGPLNDLITLVDYECAPLRQALRMSGLRLAELYRMVNDESPI